MKRALLSVSALLALAAVTPAFADGGDGGEGGQKAHDVTNRTAYATGYGQVTVFTPITVTQTRGLSFGSITSGLAGTVAIDQLSATRTVSGGVGAIAADPGARGAFTVGGQWNAAINVVVGGNITGFAGGITGVTKAANLPAVLTGASAAFSVGGVLTIPAATPAGAYLGVYTVSVNYP